MAEYRLTEKAAEDLNSIYIYTFQKFGELKADSYLMGLNEKLTELANNPELAVAVDDIREGYRKALYQMHAVYFLKQNSSILVVRVLHQQMKPSLHI